MAEEVKEKTPEAEEKKPTDETVETTEEKKDEVKPEEKKEEKKADPAPEVPVGDLVEKPEEKKENLIPESVFLGEKKGRKAAEKRVKELEEMIESGATKEEISEDIAEIAEEHNIDKSFLNKLAKSIKAQAEKELDAKYAGKFDKKEQTDNFETAFSKAYAVAIDRAPEFAKLANMEIIKTLSLQPQNAKKTVSQLLEETYGNAVTGKRTIEKTVPGGGKDPEPLDFDRANRDNKYLEEILKNPELKKEYNKKMLESGF